MRNPTTRNDTSSREDNNHVEREPTADIGKKWNCIGVKGTMSALFGMENDLPGGSHACTVMAGNSTGRSGGKYRREAVWKMLFLLWLLLELDTQAPSLLIRKYLTNIV
jgi:hypothetical protein